MAVYSLNLGFMARSAGRSSAAYHEQEVQLLALADQLRDRTSKTVERARVEALIAHAALKNGFAFSDAQQNAIQYLCEGPDIRVLNGRAGTGKTTLLKVVAEGVSRGWL